MVRSLVVAVLLSLPLVACASLDGASYGASAGGASGGSPLAGSPAISADANASANRSVARESTVAREGAPRFELRHQEVLTCRACR